LIAESLDDTLIDEQAGQFAAVIEQVDALLVPTMVLLEVSRRVMQQRDREDCTRALSGLGRRRDASRALSERARRARGRAPLSQSGGHSGHSQRAEHHRSFIDAEVTDSAGSRQDLHP